MEKTKKEVKTSTKTVVKATKKEPLNVGTLETPTQDQEKKIRDLMKDSPLTFDDPAEIFPDAYGDRWPQVGEIVLFTSNPDDTVAKANHNKEPIPAIITRVWSNVCVNLKIIPDCGPMQDRTSVVRKDANPAGYHFDYRD